MTNNYYDKILTKLDLASEENKVYFLATPTFRGWDKKNENFLK